MSRPYCREAGKPKYPNRLECDLAIADIQRHNHHHRKQSSTDEPVRSYPCSFCGGYHMTSQSKNESRRTLGN